MWKALSFVKKNLVWALLFAMGLGVGLGLLVDPKPLKATIIPLTILMIYPMMVSMNFKSLFTGCSYKLQLSTQLINFLLIPALAFGLGVVFLKDLPYAALGLLLMGTLPTSGMTISWTGFAKGNVPVAIKMTVIGLIAGAIATPLYANALMGKVVSVSLSQTALQVGLVVFVPMVLGLLTQLSLVRMYGEKTFNQSIKKKFPLVSTLGVLAMVFVAAALKAKVVVGQPWLMVRLLAILGLFYVAAYTLSSLVGRFFFAQEDAVALVYSTVMRNLSVALGIAITAFGEQGAEIALIIAAAFVIQVPSAAWYLRLVHRFFGHSSAPSLEPLKLS